MPNIEIVRFADDDFEVRATADKATLAPGITVRFLRDARTRVPFSALLSELDRFLQGVAGQLVEVRGERADAFRARLAARMLSGDAALEGRLGFVDDPEALRPLFDDPRHDQLAAIFEASAAPTTQERIDEAKRVVGILPTPPRPEARWVQLQRSLTRQVGEAAWLTGWAAASQFREAVGLAHTEPLVPDMLADSCGWNATASVYVEKTLATGVDTVHVRQEGAPPCLVTTHPTRPAQTFRVARALYHGLFGGSAALVADSRLLGSRFSEANAFAAELVAPLEKLKQLAPPSGVWEPADVDAAAHATGASRVVVRHQVENRPGLGALAAQE